MFRVWTFLLGLFAIGICLSLAVHLLGPTGVGIVFALCVAIPVLSAVGRVLRFVARRFT